MARTTLISLFTLLLLRPSSGLAQSADRPAWDAAVSIGGVAARPDADHVGYYDNWYFRNRYTMAVGRYWSTHLKTEVDYSTAAEGSLFRQDFTRVDGGGYPYSYQSFHQQQQLSSRIVWQFGDNAWVHPYVSGGLVGERERRRTRIPAQYQFADGRPSVLVPESSTGPLVQYRVGVTAGAGAKVYLTRRAFLIGAANGTWSTPAATLNLSAGFGFDF